MLFFSKPDFSLNHLISIFSWRHMNFEYIALFDIEKSCFLSSYAASEDENSVRGIV
ncbi:hypothetical protein SAMN05421830_11667 [Desulfomicrobium norvegicum]|uniref:Uncharacterized protein n=1 Tax=Desulfomicrobium norvegicum (strain DSM 1741 / NCIMB 8310) TaxID=52561 RepID=A0A8G2C5R7_DESNO|nr:hypothetical protein SAMN05421830_11667 [Desulfomicrobium norvegicum]